MPLVLFPMHIPTTTRALTEGSTQQALLLAPNYYAATRLRISNKTEKLLPFDKY